MQIRTAFGALAAAALVALASGRAEAVDPKLLPNDTEFAITVNLKQLLKSELAEKFKDLIDQGKVAMKAKLEEKDAVKYLEKAGFDLFRDLHSITVSSSGSTEPEAGFLVMEGNFAWDKLKSTALEAAQGAGKDVKVITFGSSEAFEISPEGEKTIFAGLVSKTAMIAAAKRESYADALGRANGTKASTPKNDFKKLFGTVNGKQTMSLAVTGSAITRMIENAPIPNIEQAAIFLQTIDGITASVTVDKKIGFELAVTAKDEQTASGLAKAAGGGLAFVRAMAKKKAEDDPNAAVAVEVANTLRVTSTGNNVVLRGEITGENLEVILKNLPKNR